MKLRLTLLLALTTGLFAITASAAERPPRPPLLANGTTAPDFTAYTVDKKPVNLSDLRGKVVLIDFWSTWCGPCKHAMPHMEKLHQKLKGQDFVLLGVCVWDKQDKFDSWHQSPEVPTSYLKVFDPAGRAPDNIAKALYRVSGIPTFYVIGKDGTVLHSGIGAGDDTAAALDRALAKAGLKL